MNTRPTPSVVADEELVERMARAMFDCYQGYDADTQEMLWQRARYGLMRQAERALAAAASDRDVLVGWQPIETAPKDGTWIIGAWKNFLGELGVVPLRWGVSWDNQHWANGVVVYEPAQWMPLPEPPSAALVPLGGGPATLDSPRESSI